MLLLCKIFPLFSWSLNSSLSSLKLYFAQLHSRVTSNNRLQVCELLLALALEVAQSPWDSHLGLEMICLFTSVVAIQQSLCKHHTTSVFEKQCSFLWVILLAPFDGLKHAERGQGSYLLCFSSLTLSHSLLSSTRDFPLPLSTYDNI